MIYAKSTLQSQQSSDRLIRVGGLISGVMTGALTIPGPVALWALLSSGLEAQKTRATLRAYFVVVYSLAFVVQYFFAGVSNQMLVTSLMLIPAVLGGMSLGWAVRHRLSAVHLKQLLEVLLFLMGVSLIFKGICDYLC